MSKKDDVLGACTKCNGTGRGALRPPLLRVARAIGAEWSSADVVYRTARKSEPMLSRGTFCMRITRLLATGVIERRNSQEDRRMFDYRRVEVTG